MHVYNYIKSSILELMFPKVCAICGMSLLKSQQFICSECAQNRYERAFSSKIDRINLPESVDGRFALWQFDTLRSTFYSLFVPVLDLIV